MPYKTGSWGEQALERNIRRRKYFRDRWRELHKTKEAFWYKGEEEAKILLHIKEKELYEKGKYGSCDLFWKDKKIDVKTSKILYHNGSYGWQFTLSRQKNIADYFLCIAKDEDLKTKYIFYIPNKDIKTKILWISMNKVKDYYKYLFRNEVRIKYG